MLFMPVIVLYSFIAVLARAKECGQVGCQLRCCTIPGSDVLCRDRCLGLSCELDVHCDGDCCVNSTCSSCLLKRLSLTQATLIESSTTSSTGARRGNTSTSNSETTDKPKVVEEAKKTTLGDSSVETTITTPSKRAAVINSDDCWKRTISCASNCCIDGQCVHRSRCLPSFAARGGRGGGGVRRGGGGGFGGEGGSSNLGSLPSWALLFIVFGVSLLFVLCCWLAFKDCYK